MNYSQMWLFLTNQSEPLRQSALLMLLAGGIGEGETLLLALRAHELESKGTWGGKIGQLRLLLEQGHLLSSALTVVDEVLPDETIAAIRVAEGTGALSDVLMDEAQRISRTLQLKKSAGVNVETLVVWVPAVLIVMASIISFMLIYIVPKLKEIFIGFGVDMPWATKAFISTGDWFLSYWYLFGMPALATVAVCMYLYYSSQKRRMMKGYHRLAENWPRYWVPGLLRQMSLSASASVPLSAALDSAMLNIPEGRAARRVSELRYRVQGGEDAVNAMCDVNLISHKEAAFLTAATRTHHLDWGLRHLAASIERKRGRLLGRIAEFGGPLVIILMGLLVLFVVVALFMPLVKLISDMS